MKDAHEENQNKWSRRTETGGASVQPNSRERLDVFSGWVLIIDQFMLANDQFLAQLAESSESFEVRLAALREAAKMFGGCVSEFAPGSYDVYRDARQNMIALSLSERTLGEEEDNQFESENEVFDSSAEFDFSPIIDAKGNLDRTDFVFVDTRCLVFIDVDIFFKEGVIQRFSSFREQQKEKEARDFLRESGGAVRYGFNRLGDELGVFKLADENLVALWPDVIE